MIDDWDRAYTNSIHIANAKAYMTAWPEQAARFRARAKAMLDVQYGPTARERLDLFLPAGEPRGLVVFVHGGCWMEFGKSDWSHLAAGAVARGWAAAVPSYDLCPNVRIADITRQIAAAVEIAGRRVAGPIVVIGHSAGGQLAARMMCASSPLGAATRARLERVVGISGIYDLRPLLRAGSINESLRLSELEAAAESPALLAPLTHVQLTAWVGGDELPEFLRQSALLANVWTGLAVETELVHEPGRHHFDVIDGLVDPDSALVRHALAGRVVTTSAPARAQGGRS